MMTRSSSPRASGAFDSKHARRLEEEAAEPDVLEAWGERLLAARSLDEVFAAS